MDNSTLRPTEGILYAAYADHAAVCGYRGEADTLVIAHTYGGLPVPVIAPAAL